MVAMGSSENITSQNSSHIIGGVPNNLHPKIVLYGAGCPALRLAGESLSNTWVEHFKKRAFSQCYD